MKMTCPHCGMDFDTVPSTPLREARLRKDLSLPKASNAIGISIREMTRLERGLGNPRLDVVRKITALYEQTADELFPPAEQSAGDEDEAEVEEEGETEE